MDIALFDVKFDSSLKKVRLKAECFIVVVIKGFVTVLCKFSTLGAVRNFSVVLSEKTLIAGIHLNAVFLNVLLVYNLFNLIYF